MARTYKRDARGRFASGGGSSGGGRKSSATKRTAASKPAMQRTSALVRAKGNMARAEARLASATSAMLPLAQKARNYQSAGVKLPLATAAAYESAKKARGRAFKSQKTAAAAVAYLSKPAAKRSIKPAAKAKSVKPTARRGMPKTTSARGRALQNQRRAAALVSASRGGRGPSAKAIRSVLTAQRARAFYEATGSGKKRSVAKPAAKKSAKATAAAVRARVKTGKSAVKVTVQKQPAKSVRKIKLTKEDLQSRMVGDSPGMVNARRPLPVNTDTSARARSVRRARQSQEQFQLYLQAAAIKLARASGVKGPITPDVKAKFFVEAFKNRPRYSTRQGVKPNWQFARNSLLHST